MGRPVLSLALMVGLCILTSQWTVSPSLAETVGCVADMFSAIGASRSQALNYEYALGRNNIFVKDLRNYNPFILRLLGINGAHATAFHYCLTGKRMDPACKRFKFCSGRGSCKLGKTSTKRESLLPPYVCRCTKAGYSGVLCQTDACTASPCKNGGQCVRTTRKPLFTCSCKKGFLGYACTTKDNLCRSTKPCQNGGTCRPLTGDYKCDCANGFTGRRCQNRLLTEKAFDKKINLVLSEVRGVKADVRAVKLRLAIGSATNPAKSCREVLAARGSASSGTYKVRTSGRTWSAYCEMSRSGGGWTRIGQMKPKQTKTCPNTLSYLSKFGGMCARPTSNVGSDPTVSYSSRGISYKEVMGYVNGYQYSTTDSFGFWAKNKRFYMDGVAIRYGNRHLWSYGAGGHTVRRLQCPCNGGTKPLPFVGSHYYCTQDQAAMTGRKWVPVWQGSCGGKNCCQASKGFPWFKRTLNKATTSPIRVTAMCDEGTANENVAISDMELYIR